MCVLSALLVLVGFSFLVASALVGFRGTAECSARLSATQLRYSPTTSSSFELSSIFNAFQCF